MLTLNSTTKRFACILIALLVPLAAANEYDATLTFSNSTNLTPQAVDVEVQSLNNDGTWGTIHVPVLIPPLTPAPVKRDLVKAQLEGTFGAGSVTNVGAAGLTLHAEVGRAIRARLHSGATGEIADSVIVATAVHGTAVFEGPFTPFTPENQPAVFTAGIVTDVGELTATISAVELNFQTDGPIICQALLQRLAPQAPQYGTQIDWIGDRLEIFFDPAYTVTQGGIVFGTSSLSPGASGAVETPPTAPPAHPGDLNCDGVVDFFDIDALVAALSGEDAFNAQFPGCRYLNGDCDGDGDVDFFDIDPFIDLLGG